MASSIDVLVVGGGPAGAMAARAAVAAGAKARLIEAKRRVGSMPHCAEFVPKLLAREVDIPSRARVQAVEGMDTRVWDRGHVSAGPGWILDRRIFDHHLVECAAHEGAGVLAGARFMGFENQKAVVKIGGQRHEFIAGAVVAADGASSSVAKALGLSAPDLLVGVQYQVPLSGPLDRTLVFLDPLFRGGYGWLFPKGNMANLGVGCAKEANPRARLNELRLMLLSQDVIKSSILGSTGGVIPVSGPREQLAEGNVLLCGDAAGLTHPITGAGIPQAVVSGGLAGKAAAALAGGEGPAAGKYAEEIGMYYGRYLKRGVEARKRWDQDWDRGDFAELMHTTWPALAAGRGQRR